MKYAFTNGIILDGTLDMKPVSGKVIITDGENIAEITDAGKNLSGCEVIDLQGKYIMPGLINMHVHLPASGEPKDKQSDPVKLVKILTATPLRKAILRMMCQSYAKTELFSGATTIRTMGGVLDTDTRIRDKINRGKADGPRILAANMAVSVPGGHMAGSLAYAPNSAEEAEKYASDIIKENVDVLKLMITGGVLDAKVKGEPGELKMPPEYIKACCEKAHAAGLKVAAHVESPEGVKVALENGVDTIEHGAAVTDEIIALYKEKGAAQIATISPALPYALFDRSISRASEVEQYNGDVVFRGIIGSAKKCIENGIPVGLGTDVGCSYVPHYGTWREVYLFAKYVEVSNAFALHTATEVNAKIAGIDDITGTVEVGKCADLLVTEENPLENLKALGKPYLVMARGRLYDKPKSRYKLSEKIEREMNKFL